MNFKSLFSALILLAVLVVATGQMRPGTTVPVESATPPADLTVSWVNTVNGWVYNYDSSISKWLGPVIKLTFGSNAANFTGALKWEGVGMASDTTAASASGYTFPDFDMYINYIQYQNEIGGESDGNLYLFTNSQDTLLVFDCDEQDYRDTSGVGITLTAGDILVGWLTGAVSVADKPMATLYARPIEDP
jgi:hypothetical protein